MTGTTILAVALAAGVWGAPAKGGQELKTLTAQLQGNPGDQALRERIIKLALSMKAKLAVPEDARRRMARGEAAFETARTAEELSAAAAEFQAAADAAPWLAPAYYNLGLALEKTERPGEAMKQFKLYLLAAPGAKDAAEVEKKVYKLEFMEEKKKAKAADLSGKWATENEKAKGEYKFEIYRDGGEYKIRLPPTTGGGEGITDRVPQLRVRGELQMDVTLGQDLRWSSGYTATNVTDYFLILSEDGSRLTGTFRNTSPTGKTQGDTYLVRAEP